jgi:crossover junction endodeoxyribonuclease RuvC
VSKEVRILGIDPGIARLGWGVIAGDIDTARVEYIDGGCITTKAKTPKVKRLAKIYKHLKSFIEKYQVDYIGIEKLFFSKNVKTAITVGESRGVVLLLAGQYDIIPISVGPRKMKEAIVGYGSANKEQMQKMIKLHLELDFIPTPDDFADALGVAYYTLNEIKFNKRVNN